MSLSANQGPTRVSFEGLKREALKVAGVSVRDMKVERGKLGLVLTPGASGRHPTVQLPVLCNDKKITLKLVLDLTKLPAENATVPVRLTN